MFPAIGTDKFLDKVARKREFGTLGHPDGESTYTDYSLKTFQKFVRVWMNPNTPYKNLLLYWSPGSGKTTGSISITEPYVALIKLVNAIFPHIKPRIYIITKTKMAGIQFMDTILDPRLTNYRYIGKAQYKEYVLAITEFSKNPTHENYERYRSIQKYIKKEILVPENDFFYEFLTYTKIQRKGTLFAEEWETKNFEYSFFIFDEMHEVEGNNAEDIIMSLKRRTENLRLILLSATPVNTSASEFISVLNVLRPINQILEKTDYFDSSTNEPLHGETTLRELGKLSSGYVSYVKITDDLFPERIDTGTLRKPFVYLQLVRCDATKPHQSRMLQDMKSREFKDISNIMTQYQTINDWDTVFPTGKNTVEFYTEKYFADRNDRAVRIETDTIDRREDITDPYLLNVTRVAKISPKIASLLETVIAEEGLHFIIHRQIINGGVQLIINALKANGFIEFGSKPQVNTRCYKCSKILSEHKHITDHEFKPATFVALYRNVDMVDRIRAMNTLKDPSNLFGENVKIVVGSVIIRQSVDFKYLRHIHIMNSQESLSMDLQIVGRGIRINSHSLLPPSMRNVKIYRYVVNFPNLKTYFKHDKIYNPEEYKYYRQEANFLTNQNLEYYIKKFAVDCQINKYINVSDYLLSASKKDKKKFTLMCNFHECNYKCEQPTLYKPQKQDTSTTSIVADNYTVEECERTIEHIMRRTPALKLPQLLDSVVDNMTRANAGVTPLLDTALLLLAVLNLTSSRRVITNIFRQSGTLEWHDGAVFFVPFMGASDNPLQNLKYYHTSNTINLEKIPGLYIKYVFDDVRDKLIMHLSNPTLTISAFSDIMTAISPQDQIVLIEYIILNKIEPALSLVLRQYGKFIITKDIMVKTIKSFTVKTTAAVDRFKKHDIIGHILGGKFRCLSESGWDDCVGNMFVLSSSQKPIHLADYIGFEDVNKNGELMFKILFNDSSNETDNRKRRKGLDCMSVHVKDVRKQLGEFFNVPPATFPIRGKKSFCEILHELFIQKNAQSKDVCYLNLLEIMFTRATKQIDF